MCPAGQARAFACAPLLTPQPNTTARPCGWGILCSLQSRSLKSFPLPSHQTVTSPAAFLLKNVPSVTKCSVTVTLTYSKLTQTV